MSMFQGMLHVVAAALDASDDVLAVFDVDHEAAGGLRFVEASGAFQRFCGYAPAQLAGHPLGMLAAPEAAAALHRIEAAVRSVVPLRGDLLCLERDGRRVWLGYHLMPAPTTASARTREGGAWERPRYVLIGRDITQRTAEADQARMVQGLLAKSFMHADAPLAIVTPDGHFLMTNHCFERLSGYKEGSLAGRPSFDLVSAASRPALQVARDRQMADGAAYELDVDLVAATGKLIPVRIASTLVERSDRQRCRVITLHRLARPAREQERFVAGRVAFISLEEIRASLGERWQGLAERVLETAEGMIRRRLESGDLLLRNGERGFTIRFAHDEEDQAALRAASIARDIRHHLIGRGEDASALELQVVVASGTLAGGDTVEAQMGRRLDHVEAQAQQAERVVSRPPRIRPILPASGGATLGTHVRAAGRGAAGAGIVFPQTTFDQDLAALQKAMELPQDRAAPMIFVDVDFDTFLNRSKTEHYIAACSRIPSPIRQNLVFLLSALPNGVTASLLQDVLRRLKLFGAGTGCYLGELAPPPVDLRLVPFSIIAAEAAVWHPGDAGALERLRRLKPMLQAHHARLMALDAPAWACGGLAEAGTTYVTPPPAEEGR